MTPEEFWAIWQAVEEPKPLIYRLYYDDNGLPLFYSMEDLPGNYIELDPATFSQAPSNVRVVNGKLVHLNHSVLSKLVPGDQGTACDIRDICIVVDQEKPHLKWSMKKYV